MALAKNMMIFLFLTMVVCGKSNGNTYQVGDSAGWTNVGNVDYKYWAASKTFQIGDIIMFEYNKEFHNVVRVSHENFNLCNATTTYETLESGNDQFIIRKPGHFYFICGFPGHCEAGQKVDIRVVPSSYPSPSPYNEPISGSPSTWPSPSSPMNQPGSSKSTSLYSNLGFSIFLLFAWLAFGIGF